MVGGIGHLVLGLLVRGEAGKVEVEDVEVALALGLRDDTRLLKKVLGHERTLHG